MFTRLRAGMRQLKRSPPGERFQHFHSCEQRAPRWVKVAYLALAIALLPVGVLFAFIPGPAVLFFALSAALFATQSAWMARQLDRFELAVRAQVERFQAARRERRRA